MNDSSIVEQEILDDEEVITDAQQEESDENKSDLDNSKEDSSTGEDQTEKFEDVEDSNISTQTNETEKKEDISYSTHVQDYGWQSEKSNGEMSGTSGESKRLEAISIKLDNQSDYSGDIKYQTHVQNIGWQDWKKNGEVSGTTGQNLRFEAIRIQLTDEWDSIYNVTYRVHCQDIGWMDWVQNGEIAGTIGLSKRLEAIEIKLLKISEIEPSISYKSHVQDSGWESSYRKDGQASGTTGNSKRLEGILIQLNDSKYSGSVVYRTHVQNVGWESNWSENNSVSGTVGKSLRLEAIQIQLTGEVSEHYDVYYRVHAQDYGWLGWAKNGESAGSEGFSKRLESIEIVLKEKSENAPGSSDKRFIKEAVYSITDGKETVSQYKKDNQYYLFLKNTFDLANTRVICDVDVVSVSYGNITDKYSIVGDFTDVGSLKVQTISHLFNTIEIIKSEVPSLNITLNDNVTLTQVNSGSKDVKYKSTLTIMGSDEDKYNLTNVNIEFKGRGNSSWSYPKKGYQIKLDEKQNLLGIGEGKSKKWVLLANYMDETLIKNKFMYDLCVNSALSTIPNSTFVDLYVNNNYVGNYLLCDKIEVGKNRVNLKNDDGVLVEMDFAYYDEEDYNFASSVSGIHYVIKEFGNDDMDSSSKNSAMNSFKSSIEKLETKLNNNASWSEISSLIDVDSFAKYYLVNEFAENLDSYYSSTYFYKDGSSDVIHMGPVWDYDKDNFQNSTGIDYTFATNLHNYMIKLYKYPQFAQKVDEFYNQTLKNVLNTQNVKAYAQTIKNSSRINSIVWNSESKYKSSLENLNTWVEKRKAYYESRYGYSAYNVYYSTHVQDYGWVIASDSGKTNGSVGESKRLEAIRIYGVDENGVALNLEYQTHVQDIGWQDWQQNGEVSGTSGQAKRLEAIRIRLKDSSAEEYDVYYRVHCQDIGWTSWVKNGEVSGTVGLGKRLEAIEIKLVKKENIIKA